MLVKAQYSHIILALLQSIPAVLAKLRRSNLEAGRKSKLEEKFIKI